MPEWRPTSLLGILPDAARERLLQRGSQVQYPGPSRVLFRQGDGSKFVVVILRGVVKVMGSAPSGQDTLLAILMSGDAVGEFAAVDQLPRSATVITCGSVVAQFIKSSDFLDCMRRDPEISHAVSKSIVAKMRIANARRVDFSASDATTRIARVILQLALSYGIRRQDRVVIPSQLTQPELASLAVASPPAVQRVLRKFRQAGIVATGYRSITVLDMDRLHREAYA